MAKRSYVDIVDRTGGATVQVFLEAGGSRWYPYVSKASVARLRRVLGPVEWAYHDLRRRHEKIVTVEVIMDGNNNRSAYFERANGDTRHFYRVSTASLMRILRATRGLSPVFTYSYFRS